MTHAKRLRSRRLQGATVALLVVLIGAKPGLTCSLATLAVSERHIEWASSSTPKMPPDAVFHVWFPEGGGADVKLLDSRDRSVPARVELVHVPQGGLFYGGESVLAVLRPLKSLAPGSYNLVASHPKNRRAFVVSGKTHPDPPPAPNVLEAQLVVEQCERNTKPDCSPIMGDCPYLRLTLQEAPHWDASPLYTLGWRASGGPVPQADGLLRGLMFEKEQDGTRVVRVPTWGLIGVSQAHATIDLALSAVDHAGRESAVTRATVPIESFLYLHPSKKNQPYVSLSPLYGQE